jgi:3-deoxy-manno-octulosonate cytidylyltransferase (CMP-KDO synthetase)
MRSGRVLGVIPARLASERLHRKPLHRLADRPLIEWVWRRAESLHVFDQLVIATDSDEIARTAEAFGARVVLTSRHHSSGTERIAEVIDGGGFGELACIVNIQGDEPFIEREQIEPVIALILDGWPLATCATPVGTMEAWRNPSVVKVVRGDDGRALYFSRAPIPFCRDREPSAAELGREPYLRHIGVYAYTPGALKQWVNLPPHMLEQTEKLEQLRALAGGIEIGVAVVPSSPEGVDTPEDALRAEQLLREVGAK